MSHVPLPADITGREDEKKANRKQAKQDLAKAQKDLTDTTTAISEEKEQLQILVLD